MGIRYLLCCYRNFSLAFIFFGTSFHILSHKLSSIVIIIYTIVIFRLNWINLHRNIFMKPSVLLLLCITLSYNHSTSPPLVTLSTSMIAFHLTFFRPKSISLISFNTVHHIQIFQIWPHSYHIVMHSYCHFHLSADLLFEN